MWKPHVSKTQKGCYVYNHFKSFAYQESSAKFHQNFFTLDTCISCNWLKWVSSIARKSSDIIKHKNHWRYAVKHFGKVLSGKFRQSILLTLIFFEC